MSVKTHTVETGTGWRETYAERVLVALRDAEHKYETCSRTFGEHDPRTQKALDLMYLRTDAYMSL